MVNLGGYTRIKFYTSQDKHQKPQAVRNALFLSIHIIVKLLPIASELYIIITPFCVQWPHGRGIVV